MNAMSPLLRRHSAALGFGALAVAAAGWALLPHAGRQSAARFIDDICSTVSRPMFASAPPVEGSGAAPRPRTSVKVISCEALPHVPGKSVTTAIVDFPPMAYSPAHRHPGSVTAIILEGRVRSQLAGTPPGDYRSGETFFEPPGTLHLFAENPDPVRHAKLVSVFVTEANCGPLVMPP